MGTTSTHRNGRPSEQSRHTFFDHSQNGLPLPDGLDSKLVLHSVELPWDPVHASKAGHSTRSASAVIVLDGSKYVAKAYISQGKSPFWIKVVAHKQLSTTGKPRGGRLV